MTIYTKQNVENDEKKVAEMLEVQVTVDNAAQTPTERNIAHTAASVGIDRRVRQLRKKRLCIQLFLLLGCLLGLSLCLFGTLYLYKIKSAKTYNGWCGVKYREIQSSELESTSEQPMRYLDEEVHIDGNMETLKVPKYDDNDQATFLHDFGREATFIRDETDHVCYAMPLDLEKVPAPTTFLELLFRLQRGDFVPDAEEVQENYRVLPSSLDYHNVTDIYGEHFASFCDGYNTYELIQVSEDDMLSTTPPTTTTPSMMTYRRYIMYPGGRFVIQYWIQF